MPLADLLPSVHALDRGEKSRLVQELIADLAQVEALSEGDHPVWSPFEAHEAASTLLQLMEQDKVESA